MKETDPGVEHRALRSGVIVSTQGIMMPFHIGADHPGSPQR
jgi:hypothetical protein